MLTAKKRRIAMAVYNHNKQHPIKPRIWDMLTSAVHRSTSNGEGKLSLMFLNYLIHCRALNRHQSVEARGIRPRGATTIRFSGIELFEKYGRASTLVANFAGQVL